MHPCVRASANACCSIPPFSLSVSAVLAPRPPSERTSLSERLVHPSSPVHRRPPVRQHESPEHHARISLPAASFSSWPTSSYQCERGRRGAARSSHARGAAGKLAFPLDLGARALALGGFALASTLAHRVCARDDIDARRERRKARRRRSTRRARRTCRRRGWRRGARRARRTARRRGRLRRRRAARRDRGRRRGRSVVLADKEVLRWAVVQHHLNRDRQLREPRTRAEGRNAHLLGPLRLDAHEAIARACSLAIGAAAAKQGWRAGRRRRSGWHWRGGWRRRGC